MTTPREIVCIAPDGSLEVWEWGASTVIEVRGRWILESEYLYEVVTYQKSLGPEFWGRIVLGPL